MMGNFKKLTVGSLCAAILLSLASCGSGSAAAPDGDTMPRPAASVALAAGSEAASGFTDVAAGADYADAVIWCREKDLMSGTSDTTFSPDATLTRAMVATVLYRSAGEPAVSGVPAFNDTEAGVWYSNAVIWADRNGIVQGYGNGLFGTEDPITREQLDLLVRRYKGESAVWMGDPALAVPVTRAQAAVAFYENLGGNTPEATVPSEGAPVVYMTTDISPEGLMAVYEALGWQPTGKVAVKLSTGEPPASNYLRPELIKDLVQSVDGTIVECNTAYGGSRASTAMHYQVAKDHGFTDIAPFQIMDEDGSMTLTVNGGSVLKENYVGKAFADYDSYLILSHFKGHAMAGYGGAIKNISIGIGSSEGKAWIHSGGTSKTSAWGGEQDAFLEAMAEAGKSVSDYLGNGERIVYVNVMNRLSVDCDCNGRPSEPDMHDIGILASTDPVALDQACLDLIYAQKDGDGASLVRRIESLNGLHTLEHAEEIGLGSREYQLVSIDNKEDAAVSNKVNVTFNGHTYTATLAENPTAQAFVKLIQERGGTLTVSASDYGSFEKVAPLGTSLPANNQQTTTVAGDFVLYSGNQIVLFYGSNSWSYTRLGKLDGDLSALRSDLGSGDVEITYSLVK